MADREKVIKGLAEMANSKWLWDKADYWAMVCRDALELLKGQELAVIPIPYQQGTSIGFFAGFKCGACNAVVFPDYRFCPICGKAVKWE